MKKKNFFFMMIFLVFIIIEPVSYLAFKYRYNWPVIENYKARLESVENYSFNEKLEVIMPITGTTIVHATPEFVDRFKINDYKGLGIFDDGVDNDKELYALLIGDSFTRGIGSKDNLLYGWVEIVERKIKKLDLLNLGHSGSGQIQQINFYNKIKKHFKHQIVLMNFTLGSDFRDNVEKYFDSNDYFARLPDSIDKNKFIRNVQYASNYRTSFHFLAFSPVRLYSVWSILAIYEKLISKHPPFSNIDKDLQQYSKVASMFNEKEIPASVKSLRRKKTVTQESPDGKFVYSFDPRLYQTSMGQIAERIAKHSAGIINAFFEHLRREKKHFILILHPSREQIYLNNFSKDTYNFDYARDKLKNYLNKNISLFDLTVPMRNAAKETNNPLYYRIDGHYTQEGYKIAANLICEFLLNDDFIKEHIVVNN